MKKIFTIAVLGLLASATPVVAQTVYDGAKLTGKDLNGTARFVGYGSFRWRYIHHEHESCRYWTIP